MDEAYYQSRALLPDFDPELGFKADYFDETRQRMGRKVACAVYAVTYRLLDHFDVLEGLRRQIVKAVTPTALKRILKALPIKTAYIDFYPRTPYFSNSDFVNWCWMTQNFLPVNVNRILVLARTSPSTRLPSVSCGCQRSVCRPRPCSISISCSPGPAGAPRPRK